MQNQLETQGSTNALNSSLFWTMATLPSAGTSVVAPTLGRDGISVGGCHTHTVWQDQDPHTVSEKDESPYMSDCFEDR